jgi:DNA polymerase-3 subunit alpha
MNTLGQERGLNPWDLAWIDDAVAAYANYAFKKAHAVSYATLAYQTAYMRNHEPAAFWVGMLNSFTHKGTVEVINELGELEEFPFQIGYRMAAERDGLKIVQCHVNAPKHEALTWTYATPSTICAPLTNIKNVGTQAAIELAARGPYANIDHLVQKCNPKKVTGQDTVLKHPTNPETWTGTMAALYADGALDGLINIPTI